MWRMVGHTEIFTPTMAARVAALALALGLLLQVAAAAPSCVCTGPVGPVFEGGFGVFEGYGFGGPGAFEVISGPACGIGGGVIGGGVIGGPVGSYGYDVITGPVIGGGVIGGPVGSYGYDVITGPVIGGGVIGGPVGGYGYDVVTGPVIGGGVGEIVSSSSGTYPVGVPVIAGSTAGPTLSTVSHPVCQTTVYDAPATSSTRVESGPVKEQCLILDGYCDSSCAATRAKCGGTTKNVVVAEATIIPVDSITRSDVRVVDAGKTITSVQPGTPFVESNIISPSSGFEVVEFGSGYGPGYGFGGYGAGYGGYGAGYGGYGGGYGGFGPYGTCEEVIVPFPLPGPVYPEPLPFPLPGPGCCPCYL